MKKYFSIFVLCATVMLAGNAHALIINGDFETGDFTGWTLFTTGNGTLGPTPNPLVESFDTNNDTVATNSARFQVGQAVSGGGQQGGGIIQNFTSAAGMINIGLDIASFDSTPGNNASGGVFSLLLDNVLLDTFDFGTAVGNGVEYATLFGATNVAAGLHELRILITRPFTTGTTNGNTPYQYLDNIVVDGPGGNAVPEPASMVLFGTGLVGAALRRRFA